MTYHQESLKNFEGESQPMRKVTRSVKRGFERLLALVLWLSITGTSLAESVEFSWTTPTTHTDGRSLNPQEIVGYRLYYGTTPTTLASTVDVGPVLKHTLDLPVGTWYAAVAARTATEISDRTNLVTRVVQASTPPPAPSPTPPPPSPPPPPTPVPPPAGAYLVCACTADVWGSCYGGCGASDGSRGREWVVPIAGSRVCSDTRPRDDWSTWGNLTDSDTVGAAQGKSPGPTTMADCQASAKQVRKADIVASQAPAPIPPPPPPPTGPVVVAIAAGARDVPVYGLTATGARSSTVLGVIEVGKACTGPVITTYRNDSYRRVARIDVKWARGVTLTDNVIAPCK